MTFLDRMLSLVTYLLYGMSHDGFYPSKAITGESKLTAQLRCACLQVWEVSFAQFFKANTIYDTLRVLVELEDEFLAKNRYAFWLNAFINRICRYTSTHLHQFLQYDVRDVLQRRKGADSQSSTPVEEDKPERYSYARKGRDGRANYVRVVGGTDWQMQRVLLRVVELLVRNANRVFRENAFETDREREVRFSIQSQLSLKCNESECGDAYHYCAECDLFKKQVILQVYVASSPRSHP